MRFLLDTNICIYVIRRKPEGLIRRFERLRPGDAGISSVTLAELRYGASKSRERERNHAALDAFVLPLEVAPFDERAAAEYGDVRAELEARGTPIGALDTMIGAHARCLGVVLVANDERELRRIAGLRVENWAKA